VPLKPRLENEEKNIRKGHEIACLPCQLGNAFQKKKKRGFRVVYSKCLRFNLHLSLLILSNIVKHFFNYII
jgi:hypothetical protein